MDLSELRTFLVLLFMLTIPGWAILSISRLWKKWEPLQRWFLAISISIAAYPVFFYGLRWILPSLRFGANKLSILLLIAAITILIIQRREVRCQFLFGKIEVLAILIAAITIATRIGFLKIYPYPAWSDSLHHTLITNLVATEGRLPYTLAPYAPTPLDMYHLGLYAISGPLTFLAQIPAHTALLWTAQVLNGLCGIGIYVVLSRSGHPIGAVIGMAVAGLFSFQPALYANWGRFTQVASQSILLVAWWMVVEAANELVNRKGKNLISWISISALLIAGVFLLHFRVAGFLLPLLLLAVLWKLFGEGISKQSITSLWIFLAVGLFTLLLISPALFEAFGTYLSQKTPIAESSDLAYYQFPFSSLFSIGLSPWIVVLALLAAGIVIHYRSRLGFAIILWTISLVMIGFAYLVDIPVLHFTNMGAILILLYLPASLLLGLAFSLLAQHINIVIPPTVRQFSTFFIALLIIAAAINRVTTIEPYRHFLTEGDIEAMQWINENTEEDATFAINTFFWLGSSPHGTDGGYWIPYFTKRQTTASTMMYGLDTLENVNRVIEMSRAAEELTESPPRTDSLCRLGIDYAYAGSKGNFSGEEINVTELVEQAAVDLVYQKNGVSILKICEP